MAVKVRLMIMLMMVKVSDGDDGEDAGGDCTEEVFVVEGMVIRWWEVKWIVNGVRGD